ncbi:MAG TPA: hypothetical protein VIY68_00675, partial [Steroidobacteraceae bacterium]
RQKSGAAEDGAPPAARRYRAKRGGAARAGFPSLAAFERHFANGNRPHGIPGEDPSPGHLLRNAFDRGTVRGQFCQI